MKTYSQKHSELDHCWHLVDAEGQVLDPGVGLVLQGTEFEYAVQALLRVAVPQARQRSVQEHVVTHRQGWRRDFRSQELVRLPVRQRRHHLHGR